MMKVAVAGASGYAGGELLRLLAGHSDFEVCAVTASSSAGRSLADVHPHLGSDMVIEATESVVLERADLVFLALPHGASASLARELSPRVRIVDLGADFRLASSERWQRYYPGVAHAGTWTYGLPELVGRDVIRAASRVANPGCYATAIALGFAPLLPHIDPGDLTVVAASGTSGAGRNPSDALLASQVMGSMTAYKVGGVHQHTPEIEQTLSALAGDTVRVSFTPLLAPMSRGILATLTARTIGGAAPDVHGLLADAYATEPFVRVLARGQQPATASVQGGNGVHMQGTLDEHVGRVVITVAIDNLVKGAAGQAIQNANLMCGLDETTALTTIGVAP